MNELLSAIDGFIRPQVFKISIIAVTCALVVLDAYIHGAVKRVIRPYHFIIRVFVYIVLFAFVYGMLITYLSPWLAKALYATTPGILLASVLVIFVGLGYLIERR